MVHAYAVGRLAPGVLPLRPEEWPGWPARRLALAKHRGHGARGRVRRAAGGAAAGTAGADLQGARLAARQRARLQGSCSSPKLVLEAHTGVHGP